MTLNPQSPLAKYQSADASVEPLRVAACSHGEPPSSNSPCPVKIVPCRSGIELVSNASKHRQHLLNIHALKLHKELSRILGIEATGQEKCPQCEGDAGPFCRACYNRMAGEFNAAQESPSQPPSVTPERETSAYAWHHYEPNADMTTCGLVLRGRTMLATIDWQRVTCGVCSMLEPKPAPVAAPSETCRWREGNGDEWVASCGVAFHFDGDGPADEGWQFCPGCGKGLEQDDYQLPAAKSELSTMPEPETVTQPPAAPSETPQAVWPRHFNEVDKAFELWWEKHGAYYDPDTSDVPLEAKVKDIAAFAFRAGLAFNGGEPISYADTSVELTVRVRRRKVNVRLKFANAT